MQVCEQEIPLERSRLVYRTVPRFPFVLLTALSLFLTSCAGPEERGPVSESRSSSPAVPADSETAPAPPTRPGADREALRPGEYAISVNRTLIYPLHWLRAEDVAETLQPLFESQYGPGVRVVAHAETNQLLITIPPPAPAGTTGAAPATRRATLPAPRAR